MLLLSCTITSAQKKFDPDEVKAEARKMMLARAEKENTLIGQELPHFALTLLNETVLDSESLKGKPTIINFWFIYCAPCIEEMPILNQIKNEFGDKVNFVAITYHTNKDLDEFLGYTDFDFLHTTNAETYIKSIGISGYPKTLILDQDLVVTSIERGIPKDPILKKENKENFRNSIVSKLNELLKN